MTHHAAIIYFSFFQSYLYIFYFFLEYIPEAVEQGCKRCSPNQKYLFWRFLQEIKKSMPEDYWTFRHKYDPDNKYFDILESNVSKYVKPDVEIDA